MIFLHIYLQYYIPSPFIVGVSVLYGLIFVQVNIRAQQRAKFRQITEKKQSTKEESEEQTAFFDPRVTLTSAQRSKRQFKFNEAGMHTLDDLYYV